AALNLIDCIADDFASFTADGAYDTLAIYDASAARGAAVIVPPSRSATSSRQQRSRSSVRDGTIMRVKDIVRRQWKKESGYHQQARVENTFFRYKTIVGPRLRARHSKSQKAEAIIACNILNRMTGLGMPESFAVGA
ncbi:MAG TPA: IS5/IS1182 family transposase, partial [Myxococcales bacterium]|nr:IS5/IS1182 family transposase [Myxococcales bacterium]